VLAALKRAHTADIFLSGKRFRIVAKTPQEAKIRAEYAIWLRGRFAEIEDIGFNQAVNKRG
jgi:hypothetical protein